ncbi:MAPEG family protein [Saccharospirillum mangrovi]|uniref:MAPEG family protein n=1 Tax=Saccharospirillum mangrovi TaxID=2161747 RepID=UPI000D386EC9|nr:MAPEG family protein [Saccharospirillum mangrovi]
MSFYWFCLFTVANALLLLVLALNVSLVRRRHNIANGDGDEPAVRRAIRAHANGIEYTPIFALLVLALSLQLTADWWLGVLVLGFTLGRVMHALGMLGPNRLLRFWGAAVTYLWTAAAIGVLGWELLI